MKRATSFLAAVVCLLQACSDQEKPADAAVATAAVDVAAARPVDPSNAADQYSRIHTQLGKPFFDQVNDTDTAEPLSAEVARLLEAQQPLIRELMDATKLPKCDFHIEASANATTLMPHLAEMRNLVRLLHRDGARLMATANHTEAAERIAAMIRLSRHVAADDFAIAKLVGFACFSLGRSSIDDLTAKRAVNPQCKQAILIELKKINTTDPFDSKEALAGERRMLTNLAAADQGLVGEMLGKQWTSLTQSERDRAVADAKIALEKVEQVWLQPGAMAEVKRIESQVTNPAVRALMGAMSQYRKQVDKISQELKDAIAKLGG